MKIYFQKGFNDKKPKRWYPMLSNPEEMHDLESKWNHSLSFSYRTDYISFSEKLKKFGFKVSIEKEAYSYQIYPYLYFRSYADEAAFILWAASGVDI